ncbi:MAG: flagellar assembly protein FliW [Deltaproteobacteria bacterium]|nr:flagellar assembly protein FliW [Deltaproteobacteria bacterium]
MIFQTERFGEIEAEEEELLYLPNGIIGFPDCTSVLLLDHRPNSPFRWLQSVTLPELAFVVIDPLQIVPDYPLDYLRSTFEKDAKQEVDLAVAVIATVPPSPAPITINLVAPIVFDANTRKGAQVILHDDRFKTRHVLAHDPPKK